MEGRAREKTKNPWTTFTTKLDGNIQICGDQPLTASNLNGMENCARESQGKPRGI